jgi:2-methylcitrate dehydratase PrpD
MTGTDTGRLKRLVEWALGPEVLRPDDVPHAISVVTDTLAAIIGASVESEVGGFASAARRIGGDGRATVLANGDRTSPFAAALANGLSAVRLELDEGNQFAANHPSAHVLPAVLAVAEEVDATGAELLSAWAAGYEVATRVGAGVRLRREVHPFGTAMVCGAAVGVARLRRLDVAAALESLLIGAALVPASTQRAANTGATVRNAITGVCAADGVLAVELATTGTTADRHALQTVFGQVLGDAFDETSLDAELGTRRYLPLNYLKLHACSRWNHAPIEATEALLAAHGFSPEDVESVEVATYDPATRLDGRDTATGFAGKHSIPYSVAVRIALRSNGIEAYTDEVAADPAVRRLMSLVTVVEDPAFTDAAPAIRAARVTVRLQDGRVLAATENRAPGGFDRPYPENVIASKHRVLLTRALGGSGADAVLGWCQDLPHARSVRGLHELVGASR